MKDVHKTGDYRGVVLSLKKVLLYLVLPLLAPVTFLLFTLSRYGVSVPYGDAWSMVPIFQKIDSGGSPLSLLWQPWNEHRVFFPRLLLTVSAYITDWHIAVEVLLSVCFGLIAAVFLYFIIQQSIKRSLLAFLTMLISSFWLFSPVQSENWLWGWCVEWFMCIAFVMAMIFFISRLRDRLRLNLTGAIVASILATFSLGGALIIWLVGLFMLIVKKQKRKPIIIWCSAAMLSIATYYYKYQPTNGRSGFSFSFLHQPIDTLSYYLALFGRPFVAELDTSMLFGSIVLLLLVPALLMVWDERDKLDAFLPWLALILFSLSINALLAISRVGDGVYNATGTRYTTFTILFIIGLTGLFMTLLNETKAFKSSQKLVNHAVLATVLVSIPLIYSSYSVGLYTSKLWNTQMLAWQQCITQPVLSDDCLLGPQAVKGSELSNKQVGLYKEQIQFLKDKHWAGF